MKKDSFDQICKKRNAEYYETKEKFEKLERIAAL